MAGLLLRIVGREIPNGRLGSELQALQQASQEIAAIVEDAEQRQRNDKQVKDWLTDVKNLYYDVVDVIDEWNIVKGQRDKKRLLSRSSISFFNTVRLNMAQDTARKMRGLMKKMELIRQSTITMGIPGTSNFKKEVKLSSRSKYLDETMVYGRDLNLKTLMSMLLSGNTKKASVYYVAILGMPGIGKTTLAQLLFEVLKHFHLRAWVSVSDEFNSTKILKEIIESVTGISYQKDEVGLELLIQGFRETVGGKRFIFVLDDVWENYSKWELLKNAFEAGAPGSVILTTTRSQKVALTAGSTYTMPLHGLSEDDSWFLLRHLAFGTSTDVTGIETFGEVGKQIANKCRGLPVALRAVGGLLRSKTSLEDWQQVLMEFEKFSGIGFFVMPTFMLSYCDLDPLLRQCLLFCSIFPENHSINVDKLIKLWMAQDYFDDAKSEEMETQGQYCFEELLSRSFFQNLRKDDHGNSLWNMHNTFTDFIQHVACNECSMKHFNQYMKLDRHVFFGETRHWTLWNAAQTIPIFDGNKEKVHTLMIINEDSFVDPTTLSNELPHFKRLRALDWSHCLLRELPSKIGKLLHLRYLDFSFNHELKQLPEALCDLSVLQTLNLNGCDSLIKLPKGIGKLIRLRHLEILWTTSLSYLPKGIGSLTSLRTLNRFIGTSDINSKTCNLGDLEKLSNLQGYISIDGLGGVTDVALAQKASRRNKELVRDLDLWFSGVRFDSDDVAVLKVLQPPPNLRRLGLFLYRGTSFPDWMETMVQLRHLMLSDCSGCEILPPLWRLPSLETLEMRNMINLKKVGPEFLGIESDSDDRTELVSTIYSDNSDVGEVVILAIIAGGGGSHSKETISDIDDGGKKVMSTTGATSRVDGKGATSAIRVASGSDCGKEITSEIRAVSDGNHGKEITSYISDGCQSATRSSHNGGNEAFPNLKKLKFHNLTNWEKWAEINGSKEYDTVMPKLSSLSIVNCSSIRAIPGYIRRKRTLKRHIAECPLLNLNEEGTTEN